MLPDQVLSMIGSNGSNVNLGKENEGKINSIFVGGTRGLSSGITSTGRMMDAAKEARDRKAREAKQNSSTSKNN